MKILVLAVGRLKEELWAAAEAEYLKRLRRYATIEVRQVKDEAALLRAVPSRSRFIALDARGELYSSDDIASKVLGAAEQHGGGATLVFAIGGPEGFSDQARRRAERLIAFGRVTLPHRLARVLLLEQIYRGFTILRGEPYHK